MLREAGKGLVERVEGVIEGVGEYVSRWDHEASEGRRGALNERSLGVARFSVLRLLEGIAGVARENRPRFSGHDRERDSLSESSAKQGELNSARVYAGRIGDFRRHDPCGAQANSARGGRVTISAKPRRRGEKQSQAYSRRACAEWRGKFPSNSRRTPRREIYDRGEDRRRHQALQLHADRGEETSDVRKYNLQRQKGERRVAQLFPGYVRKSGVSG